MSNAQSNQRNAEREDVRLYYQIQYERISQLEQQRLTMTTLVITLSTVAFALAFEDLGKLNVLNAVGLPLVIIFANAFAAFYAYKSRRFIKMHQARSRIVMDHYFNDLKTQLKSAERDTQYSNLKKPESDADLFNRTNLQIAVHILLLLVALLPIFLFYNLS